MALSQQFYINNRKKLGEQLENDSLTIIFSGREIQMTEDANYPFFANNNFYYLTGIREPELLLLLVKNGQGEVDQLLFVEETDLLKEKWVGKKISQDQAAAISGIDMV